MASAVPAAEIVVVVTVMAAAAIEALFWGNDAFNFEPDSGAVVLWFSDDPSLNEQSRARLHDVVIVDTAGRLPTQLQTSLFS